MIAAEGVAGMVAAWLQSFGPGTAADIKWWLGSTVTAVRQALADLGAVEVELDGKPGCVLPDDLDPADPVAPWAALLPSLDLRPLERGRYPIRQARWPYSLRLPSPATRRLLYCRGARSNGDVGQSV